MNLRHALDVAVEIASDIGNRVMEMRDHELPPQDRGRDVVSAADLFADSEISSRLRQVFPSVAVDSEESPLSTEAHDWRWVVDPLDGTINFLEGLPMYSTSLALLYRRVPQVGVIYAPSTAETFTSTIGKGSYLNGERIAVSQRVSVSEGVFAFMLASHYESDKADRSLKAAAAVARRARGLRLYVSQALELGYVASGRLEGTIAMSVRGYSSAAGILLVREAGGRVTDLTGNEFRCGKSQSLLATNTFSHAELLELITA